MALIRQSASGTLTRDAVVLDLGDLLRQGEQVRTKARADAERIVAEAKAERERLIAGAAEEGRSAGMAAGLEEGRKQGQAEGRLAALAELKDCLTKLEAGWLGSLGAFDAARDQMLLEARQDVVRLAATVAELVTKRALALEPARVGDQLGAVLAMLARPTRLVVKTHPDDLPLLEQALPALQEKYRNATHVEIVPDDTLDRGSCIARTGTGGVIDASVQEQLRRIVEILLPGPVGDAAMPGTPSDAPAAPEARP